MTKLLGSLCVFAAGGMVWYLRRKERRSRRTLLADLIATLDGVETGIRLTRTPLPRLLAQAAERGGAAAAFFKAVSRGLTAGERPTAVWRRAAVELPLSGPERNALLTLAEAAQGDEESACKGISLVRKTLEESLRQMEKQRMEEDRRSAALCFSAAALTVILLI